MSAEVDVELLEPVRVKVPSLLSVTLGDVRLNVVTCPARTLHLCLAGVHQLAAERVLTHAVAIDVADGPHTGNETQLVLNRLGQQDDRLIGEAARVSRLFEIADDPLQTVVGSLRKSNASRGSPQERHVDVLMLTFNFCSSQLMKSCNPCTSVAGLSRPFSISPVMLCG
jgi:hypothetical protein